MQTDSLALVLLFLSLFEGNQGLAASYSNTSNSKYSKTMPIKKIAGIDLKKIEAIIEKLKTEVAATQEECKKKQERLDEIARLTGESKEHIRALIPAIIVNEVVIKKLQATKKVGPGTYMDHTSFSYVRGSHSYNIASNILFQEMNRHFTSHQSPKKAKEAIASLYVTHAHEAALNPSIVQQRESIKPRFSPSPTRPHASPSFYPRPSTGYALRQSRSPKEEEKKRPGIIKVISMNGYNTRWERNAMTNRSIKRDNEEPEENLQNEDEEFNKSDEFSLDEEDAKANPMPCIGRRQ